MTARRTVTEGDIDRIHATTDELDDEIRSVGSRLDRVEMQQSLHEANDIGRHGEVMRELTTMRGQGFKLIMALLAAVLALAGVNIGVEAIKPATAAVELAAP